MLYEQSEHSNIAMICFRDGLVCNDCCRLICGVMLFIHWQILAEFDGIDGNSNGLGFESVSL